MHIFNVQYFSMYRFLFVVLLTISLVTISEQLPATQITEPRRLTQNDIDLLNEQRLQGRIKDIILKMYELGMTYDNR